MADKVTTMVLKVDLQCPCCYKKVKKILCKFPQIRDRMFDVKQNTVTITVVCCNPERLRDKLCCKGRKVIQSIEIKEPPKPAPAPAPVSKPAPSPVPVSKPAPAPVPVSKPAPAPVPVVVPKPAPTPAPVVPTPKPPELVPQPMPIPIQGQFGFPCCLDCYEGRPGGPCYQGYGRRTCCNECYGGNSGGPCYQSDDYSWRPVPSCDNYGYYGRRTYQVSPCNYFNEENAAGCAIM